MIVAWTLFACTGAPLEVERPPLPTPQTPTELPAELHVDRTADRALPPTPEPPVEAPEFLTAPAGPTASRSMPLRFSGVGALCEEDDTVWASVEYIGPLAEATVIPWVGGAPSIALPLTLDRTGVFAQASGEGIVLGCEDATWVWELAVAGQDPACMVTGPDAAEVLTHLPEGCLLQ